MLFLHQSNRLEQLLHLLCKTLASTSADPLCVETVVVQNPGMARWVFQQIALRDGIAANLDFPLPATFIWRMLDLTLGDIPDISLFSREVLLWRILRGLEELADTPLLTEICRYLGDDPEKIRRIQLADRISDLFDQYLIHRPDMLLDWERKKPEHWQMRLWQWLTDRDKPHRARLMEQFFQKHRQGLLYTDRLPKQICLFGLNTLAPVYIEILAALSEYTDVHLFHLSPCRQAWDDIVPPETLSRQQKVWLDRGLEDVSDYYTSGNPLLASLGKVGRNFFQLLLQHQVQENDIYEDPDQRTLLGAVQADILDLLDRTGQPGCAEKNDTSIQFHICHSPMREVQVLHNRLLHLFEDDPDLKPGDILVMAPDINRYAAAIAGVFGAAETEMRIPWSVADRSRQDEDHLISGFLALLSLPDGRCTSVEVLALLENPAIGGSFAIHETDLPQLRSRIAGAGIRWGLDREQCTSGGLPDLDLYTWSHGLARLLLGHCCGASDKPWQDLIASATEAGSGHGWLGGLASFLRRLRLFAEKSRQKQTPAAWQGLLQKLIDDFFTDQEPYTDSCMLLRTTLQDCAEQTVKAGFTQPLSLAEIRYYLEERLAGNGGGHAFLAGRVTFCNMVPMRSVPFKVICLLGMNAADYPRCPQPADFDLIANQPRPGDRNRRDDDRYLFLEAILSARRHLLLFWVGRDLQENTELPPATVVAELRDYLDRGWHMADGGSVVGALTTEHPLQPFSAQCFTKKEQTRQYGTLWFPEHSGPAKSSFFTGPLASHPVETIRLVDLTRFWNDPIRFLLAERLGLRLLRRHDEALPDEEPFALDPLAGYLLKGELIARLRRNGDPASICARAAADGLLPGFAGQNLHCRTLTDETASLLDRFEQAAGEDVPPLPVELALGDILLTGQLDSLHGQGRVVLRPARYKGRDLFRLWVHHLVLCLLRPPGVRPVSTHIAPDATLILHEVTDPEQELARLVDLYPQGLCRPLHFYPDVNLVMARARTPEQGRNAARKKWYSGYYPGMEEQPEYRLALMGDTPLDSEFEELATLFEPLFDVLKIEARSSK